MQSTFDRRRVNGPEESYTPVYDSDEDEQPESSSMAERRRRSGRSAKDIRPIFLKTGLISQANGSAYIETERTKIACAVYGPRQSKTSTYNERGRLNVEVKFAPFSCKQRRAPLRDAEDRPISVLIHQALLPAVRLELFPKSTVDVFITILENDGIEGCAAAGATVASTALADAGIDMLGLVVSCASCVASDGDVWLDPTAAEARSAKGCFTLATVPALGLVTNVWQTGRMSLDEADQCMDLCQEQCLSIHSVVAQTLIDANANKSESAAEVKMQ